MNYWQTLHELKIYSLERRHERYGIIYMWKILEGLVPNINNMSNLEPNSESLISIEPGTPANVNEQARGSYHNMAS